MKGTKQRGNEKVKKPYVPKLHVIATVNAIVGRISILDL